MCFNIKQTLFYAISMTFVSYKCWELDIVNNTKNQKIQSSWFLL